MITLNIEHDVFMGGRREMWRFQEGSGGELVFQRGDVEVRISLSCIENAIEGTARHLGTNVSAAEVEARTRDIARRSGLDRFGEILGVIVTAWWRAGWAAMGAALAPACRAIAETYRPLELD